MSKCTAGAENWYRLHTIAKVDTSAGGMIVPEDLNIPEDFVLSKFDGTKLSVSPSWKALTACSGLAILCTLVPFMLLRKLLNNISLLI